MKATIVVIAIGVLAPSSASAWPWSSGSQSSNNQNNQFGSKPFSSSSNSDYDRSSKKPYWQQRYETRQQEQWGKPGGGNFPRPVREIMREVYRLERLRASQELSAAQQARYEMLLKLLLKLREKDREAQEARERNRQRGILNRLHTAWKSLWKNRTIGAGSQSPFENNGGFGENVRRASPLMGMSWRTRFDIRQRIHRGPTQHWQGRRLAPMY